MEQKILLIEDSPAVIKKQDEIMEYLKDSLLNFEWNLDSSDEDYLEIIRGEFKELRKIMDDVKKSNEAKKILYLEELTKKRNQLNRQIAKLKKKHPYRIKTDIEEGEYD